MVPEVVSPDPILVAVLDLLDGDGCDAVQLRAVARRARVSLTTIYKRYSTRDELIVAALEFWMDEHRYSDVAALVHVDVEMPVHERLTTLFRTIFVPWEAHPRMLDAYIRARSGPDGQRLARRGFDVVAPVARELLSSVSPEFAAEIERVMSAVIYGALAQFADGALRVDEIVPVIERATYWLLSPAPT